MSRLHQRQQQSSGAGKNYAGLEAGVEANNVSQLDARVLLERMGKLNGQGGARPMASGEHQQMVAANQQHLLSKAFGQGDRPNHIEGRPGQPSKAPSRPPQPPSMNIPT